MQTKFPCNCKQNFVTISECDDSTDDESISVYEPDSDESTDDENEEEVLSTETVSLVPF